MAVILVQGYSLLQLPPRLLGCHTRFPDRDARVSLSFGLLDCLDRGPRQLANPRSGLSCDRLDRSRGHQCREVRV